MFVARRFLRSRRTGFLSLNAILSALGFVLGVASLIIALALMTGFQSDVIERIMGSNAHVLVYPADGNPVIENPGRPGGEVARIEAVEGVVAAQPVVHGFAGVTGGVGAVQWATITGVSPEGMKRVTDMGGRMVHGRLEDLSVPTATDRPPVVLGSRLAARLGVMPGEPVQLIVPRPRLTPWGVSARIRVLEVVGLFETGFVEYDESWAFVSLATGQRLFDAPGGAHRIAARVQDLERLTDVEERIAAELGPGYFVDDVIRQNRVFFSALRLEKLLMSLAVGLIVLVAALGIVSSLVLTVAQKTREIGVLVALGATPRGVMKIFVLQGMAMGIIGTVLGAALGAGLSWTLDRFQIIRLDPEVYYLDSLPFRVDAVDMAWIVGLALVVAFLATLYPAWRAARLDPVEALRDE